MASRVVAPQGYVSVREFAEKNNVTRRAVEYWLHMTLLPYCKVGSKRFIKEDAVPPSKGN